MSKQTYTVIGFYADNMQPWITFIEASSPKAAAKLGIKTIYDNGNGGAELNDIRVVEVVNGQHLGMLINQKVVNLKDLNKRKG